MTHHCLDCGQDMFAAFKSEFGQQDDLRYGPFSVAPLLRDFKHQPRYLRQIFNQIYSHIVC